MSYEAERLSAERAAQNVLATTGTRGRPIDVIGVARAMGIQVQSMPLDDELSGMAFIKDGLQVIVVNSQHHPNRQRFTVAHELGHHVMHALELQSGVHVDKVIFNRNARSRTGEDVLEVQANTFAAEILIPKAELRLLGSIDVNNDQRISDLAREFRVSQSAMAIRVDNLYRSFGT